MPYTHAGSCVGVGNEKKTESTRKAFIQSRIELRLRFKHAWLCAHYKSALLPIDSAQLEW